jgi:hypothetical protein
MKIQELLATPDKWTQKAYARDNKGEYTGELGPDAVCFCFVGAANRCYPDGDERTNIKEKVRIAVGRSPISWNDTPGRTHAEVLALAIELDI